MLSAVDSQINTTTGTVKLRADFDNPDDLLFPNQFVNVRLLVDTLAGRHGDPGRRRPARRSQEPSSIVVKPDDTVAVTQVTLGPQDGENVAVTQGLSARRQGRRRRRRPAARRRQGGAAAGIGQPGQPPTPARRNSSSSSQAPARRARAKARAATGREPRPPSLRVSLARA